MRTINLGTDGAITDGMVAGFGEVRDKATEATGHTSHAPLADSKDIYADSTGTHAQRLVEACWQLGGRKPWAGLRRWAHARLRGHFLTKAATTRHALTPAERTRRVAADRHRRTGTDRAGRAAHCLVVNFLDFVGAGWHTTGDALLANTAAAKAREQRRVAREELTTAPPHNGTTVKPASHALALTIPQ